MGNGGWVGGGRVSGGRVGSGRVSGGRVSDGVGVLGDHGWVMGRSQDKHN